MNRHQVKKIDSIPETYSDGYASVFVFDGELCVGVLSENGEQAFAIPVSVFELLIRVFDQYLANEMAAAHEAKGKPGGLN